MSATDMECQSDIPEVEVPIKVEVPEGDVPIEVEIPEEVPKQLEIPEEEVPKKFLILLYAPQFSPVEILVKVIDKTIWILGEHDEKVDEHGFVSRKFSKHYPLPDFVKEENLRIDFKSNGVLIIREEERGCEQQNNEQQA